MSLWTVAFIGFMGFQILIVVLGYLAERPVDKRAWVTRIMFGWKVASVMKVPHRLWRYHRGR
jgi:hypothetical protein